MWTEPVNHQRVASAVSLAAELHRGQVRKGTRVPYLSHLLAVAALVAEDEGSEDEVLAALLHDAAEDQGGEVALARIQDLVGDVVADIVRQCSDSILEKGQDKQPWRVRKQEAIDLLSSRSSATLRVIAADKLHNVRTTAADLQLGDSSVWNRFKTGRDGFLWYHHEVSAELQRLLPESRSVRLLELELAVLEEL